jgi:hypothetical protein
VGSDKNERLDLSELIDAKHVESALRDCNLYEDL